jgi:hypothetical protein
MSALHRHNRALHSELECRPKPISFHQKARFAVGPEDFMKTPEYIEGQKAKENFDQAMKTLFQAPKPAKPAKQTATTDRKTKLSDKD